MDLINIDTNKIAWSAHTPDYDQHVWVDIRSVDFSALGVDIKSDTWKQSIRQLVRSSFSIASVDGSLKATPVPVDPAQSLELIRIAKLAELRQAAIDQIISDKIDSDYAVEKTAILEAKSEDTLDTVVISCPS